MKNKENINHNFSIWFGMTSVPQNGIAHWQCLPNMLRGVVLPQGYATPPPIPNPHLLSQKLQGRVPQVIPRQGTSFPLSSPQKKRAPISRHKSLALSLTQASRGEVSEWLSPTAVSQENCPHHSTGCCGHASSVSEGVGALRPLGACPSCRQNTHQPLLARLELTKAGL